MSRIQQDMFLRVSGSIVALALLALAANGCDSGFARKHLGTVHPRVGETLTLLEAVPGYSAQGAQLRELWLDGQIWVIDLPGRYVGACQSPIPLIELDRDLVHYEDNLVIAPVLVHELYHFNNPWHKERHARAAGMAWTAAFWLWQIGDR